MGRVLVGIGLVTKRLVLAVPVTIVESTTRLNARPTAGRPLKDGKLP